MTQEEKQLLMVDLCGRLPYGVKCLDNRHGDSVITDIDIEIKTVYCFEFDEYILIENIKPYLRPMESMTEEEKEELSDYLCEQVMSNKIGITIPPNPTQGKGIPFIWMGDCLNWFNKKGFDYRGLIPMGLALEAPEGMYEKEGAE